MKANMINKVAVLMIVKKTTERFVLVWTAKVLILFIVSSLEK